MRPPPSPNGDQLLAWEKTALTLYCSVCLAHRDAGLTGSFCIHVVYLDGWVVYPASTKRSSNVELKLIHRL